MILFISVPAFPLQDKIGSLMENSGIEITENIETIDNNDSNGFDDAINGNRNLSSQIKIFFKYIIYGNCF